MKICWIDQHSSCQFDSLIVLSAYCSQIHNNCKCQFVFLFALLLACLLHKSTAALLIFINARSLLKESAINKLTMAEASLAFPIICLILSFLFLVAVYHPSIMRHLGAFHHRIILPVYQQIARKLLNRNPINRTPPNRPEAGYEALNLDTEEEEEQSPAPLATSSTPSPGYHRHGEDPVPNTFSMLSESDTETEMDLLGRTTSYAGGPYRPRRWSAFAEMAGLSTHSQSRSPSGSLVSSDEYDSEWSNSALDEAVSEPRNQPDDIPIWEFELERPIYNVDSEGEQGGPMVWVDEVVEWTSQGIFAIVSPDIMDQRR